jgi:hypothetical protein
MPLAVVTGAVWSMSMPVTVRWALVLPAASLTVTGSLAWPAPSSPSTCELGHAPLGIPDATPFDSGSSQV